MRKGEGRLSADGAIIVRTGVHTGRSVGDKFVADEPSTTADVWWGKVNQKLPAENFRILKSRVQAYLQGRELFTQDLYAGADPANRIRVRLVTTGAWQALFARNMFIRPPASELPGFTPDYVILHAPEFEADPAIDGVKSTSAIALSFAEKLIVIAGTQYAGEIKKSIFTVMNWILPPAGVLPMHCSANIGKDEDAALFFGLSGTGKTTTSKAAATPKSSTSARKQNPKSGPPRIVLVPSWKTSSPTRKAASTLPTKLLPKTPAPATPSNSSPTSNSPAAAASPKTSSC